MHLRKVSIVLVAVLALSAVIASSASAAAVKQPLRWYVGPAGESLLSGSEAIAVKSTGSAFELGWNWGGKPATLQASGVSCVSCSITNSSTWMPNIATGAVRLKFTGVKTSGLAGCVVPGGTLVTQPLRVEVAYTEEIAGKTAVLAKFVPASGSSFMSVVLEEGEAACSIEGSYGVTGSVFALDSSPIGGMSSEPSFQFSAAINKAAGGALLFGSEPFSMTGSVGARLNGTRAGSPYGVK